MDVIRNGLLPHQHDAAFFRLCDSLVRGKDDLKGIETLSFDEDIVFGLFLGTDIYLDRSGQTALFVEGNIIDENSLAAGVKVRF